MTQYFKAIGMPTTMKELGVNPSDYGKIADLTTEGGKIQIPSYIPLTREDLLNIYRLAE